MTEREAYNKAWADEMNRQSAVIRQSVIAGLDQPDRITVWALRICAASAIIAVFAGIMAVITAFLA